MLTCGTGRSAGHSALPKHASAAWESGQTPKCFAPGELIGVVVIVVACALERQPEGADVQPAAGGRIWRDHRHAGEKLDVHAASSFDLLCCHATMQTEPTMSVLNETDIYRDFRPPPALRTLDCVPVGQTR